jgi:hypothetical protein
MTLAILDRMQKIDYQGAPVLECHPKDQGRHGTRA